MNNEDIERRVREVVVHSLALEGHTIELDDDFTVHHGADDLDIIKLALDLEEEFDIRIDDEELSLCRTLECCIKTVKEALSQRA